MTQTAQPEKELTFEQALDQLDKIVEQVEKGEIGLEQSIGQYEKGMTLIKYCRDILSQAEKRIETIKADTQPAEKPEDA